MIEIKVDPILFHLGTLVISWHGLWLAVGILACYFTFQAMGKKAGLRESTMAEVPLVILVSGFMCARLFGLSETWRYYLSNPTKIIAINLGGLTITGGILGGLLATALYAHVRRIPLLPILDLMAFATPIGDIVGRVGCLILGDVWGVPTGSSWGLVYLHPNAALPNELVGVPTFPVPIAFMVWDLAILAILFWVRRRTPPQGSLFILFLGIYGLERIVIAFWQPRESLLLEMNFIQWIGFLMIVIAGGMRIKIKKGGEQSV